MSSHIRVRPHRRHYPSTNRFQLVVWAAGVALFALVVWVLLMLELPFR